MKTAKKLVTVVFPKSVLSDAKATQKKHGLHTLSALLRVAVEDPSSVNLKTKEEPQVQVSFRVEEHVLATLSKLASQNDKSLAEVVRMLVKNVARIPAKRFAAAAALEPAPRKSTKKSAAKKAVVSVKKIKPVAKKSAPSKKRK